MAIHQDLFAYIEKSPTPFHAVAESARRLEQAFGYIHIGPQIFDKIKDIFLIIFDNIRLFRQNNRKNRA